MYRSSICDVTLVLCALHRLVCIVLNVFNEMLMHCMNLIVVAHQLGKNT